ncbi:MAG: B12-binding domain-containing radical SAM protein [Candidatus Lambdaproteobacteria bacterium]|nr:B12-binding domain-containing radical SAM protein [Candidatus Lambdaproteobacteria bacterium]
MRIAISYPPIVNDRGQKAMVSQNRNVQFFKAPTYLLPVIQAQAATWLRDLGHQVYWDDGNAQLKDYGQWFDDLVAWRPEIVVFESTTPVMKFYWRTVDELKARLPDCVVIMTGYHSMRRPEETLQRSRTDVVLRSNHIDFVLKRLVSVIERRRDWRGSADLEGLAIRLDDGSFRSTGNFRQVEPLERSPDVDRELVQWKNYAYENGNFLQTPGTYATSVIRDCMFGKCTFCRYNGPDLTFSMRPVEQSLDEYQRLIEQHGVREIFDDSGVWYRGQEARRFAQGIIDRGLHQKGCYFGFNTRFEYLDEETIKLLAKANFRFVLIGLEAADDETLERLNKGYKVQHVEQALRLMTEHGLHPHLTIMVGYYWQTQQQLDRTVRFVRSLMFRGLARTLQVTICTPLDFTPYHQECIQQGVLLTEDYDDFDMSRVIVRTPIPHDRYYEAIRRMYGVAFHPLFVLRQMRFLASFRRRDWQFLFTYGWRAIRRVRNHVFNLTSRHVDAAAVAGSEAVRKAA